MLAKTGGFAALLDRGVVTQCPLCDTDNPDLENHGFCSSCGALFRDKINWRLMTVKAAIALGVLLTVAGAAATLAFDWYWTGLAVFALGIVPLAFGILANRQLAGFLLEALGRRAANDTQRSLRTTDRLAAGLLVFFVAAAMGSVPYYLYRHRPRQELADLAARFESQIDKYVNLVPADAVPPRSSTAYLDGKAVVVEKSDSGWQVAATHLALSPDVRAESPDEVGTVVLVEWSDFPTTVYSDNRKGFRVEGHFRIINLAEKQLLYKDFRRGGKPPDLAPADGSPGRGPKPISEIVEIVNNLKPRPASEPPPAGEGETPGDKDQGDPKPEPSANK